MQRIDLEPPAVLADPAACLDAAAAQLELAVHRATLTISSRSTLRAFAGSRHWHLKPADAPRSVGTLELTLTDHPRQLWVSVHENRTAPWIADAAMRLREQIRLLNAPA